MGDGMANGRHPAIRSDAPRVPSPLGRFEDSDVWLASMRLATRVMELVSNSDEDQRGDVALCNSLRESSIALPSLVADAYERRYPAEQLEPLSAARGMCARVRTGLFLMSRLDLLPLDKLAEIVEATHELSGQITDKMASVERMRQTS